MSTYIFQTQSTLIVLLLTVGLFYRKNTFRHSRIMRLAIIWDILLVLQIELNRGAIAQASKMTENNWLLNFHVAIAVSTVLLFIFLLYSGSKLLKGKKEIKKTHVILGLLAYILRLSTYITSFMVNGQQGA